MRKIDGVISFIIGFLIGVFFFIVLKTIGFDIPYRWLLIVFFPPAALLGMWLASLAGKRFLFVLQAGKFALVGALNTFVDLGILNFLIFISGAASGIWYSVFKAVAFLIATFNSYYWNKYWTFGKRERGAGVKEFTKFLLTVTVGLLLNVGIASLVVNVIGPQFGITEKAWASVGAFAATLLAWVWNFFGSKILVFKK